MFRASPFTYIHKKKFNLQKKNKNLLKKKAEMLNYKRIKITQKKRQGLQTSPCFKVFYNMNYIAWM